jgi:hypothetical protein
MDFVYICRTGPNEELRYSIRSVVHSFPKARIWVVGGKPDWYKGHYIEVDQSRNKYTNALNNLLEICNSKDILDTFVLMNDDFFILKKIKEIKNFHGGLLLNKIKRYKKINETSTYIKKLILTDNKMRAKGIENPLDYDLHVPMVMEKDKLKNVITKYSLCLWRSAYGNIYDLGGDQIEDVKIYFNKKNNSKSIELNKEFIFISTEDNSFSLIKDRLKLLFPNSSKFE